MIIRILINFLKKIYEMDCFRHILISFHFLIILVFVLSATAKQSQIIFDLQSIREYIWSKFMDRAKKIQNHIP